MTATRTMGLLALCLALPTSDALAQAAKESPPVEAPEKAVPPQPELPVAGSRTHELPGAPEEEEKATAGWMPKKGGFVLRAPDDNYLLRLGLQTAYKYEPRFENGQAESRAAFFVLRPIFAGNLYEKWIHFWTSLELRADPPYVLDTYVDFEFMKEFGLRVGQQYTPWSRHESRGPQQILFPDWDFVADLFWTGRDKGLTAYGLPWKGIFEYYVGLYSGSPLRQFTSIPGNYVLETRLTLSPLGPPDATEYPYSMEDSVPLRYSFSLQAYSSKVQISEANLNPASGLFEFTATGQTTRNLAGGADFYLQADRFTFTVEAYLRNTDLLDGTPAFNELGAWAQLGVSLQKRLILGLRGSYLDPSTLVANDQLFVVEGLLSWLVDPTHLHLQLRYAYGHQQNPAGENLGPVTLTIGPGNAQILTLQVGAFY